MRRLTPAHLTVAFSFHAPLAWPNHAEHPTVPHRSGGLIAAEWCQGGTERLAKQNTHPD